MAKNFKNTGTILTIYRIEENKAFGEWVVVCEVKHETCTVQGCVIHLSTEEKAKNVKAGDKIQDIQY